MGDVSQVGTVIVLDNDKAKAGTVTVSNDGIMDFVLKVRVVVDDGGKIVEGMIGHV